MMSGFSQAKQVWVAPTNLFQEEIQRRTMPIKLWCWWFNRQHPYCKVSKELVSLWCKREEKNPLCPAKQTLKELLSSHPTSCWLIHKNHTSPVKVAISDRSQSLNYEPHKINVRGKSSVSLAFQTVSGVTTESVDPETSYTGVIPVEILPLSGKFWNCS